MIDTLLALTLIVSEPVIVVEFGPPVTVEAAAPYRASGCVALGAKRAVTKAWTFIGSDRGNILEADIQLSGPKLDYFLQRSDHRETPGHYDAWKSESVKWTGDVLCVQVSATPTTPAPIRVHFQVRLEPR